MATNFANALKLLQAKQEINKESLGYVNTILTGSSISKQVPIVQPNEFFAHKFYEKKQKSSSLLTARTLNSNPDPTAVNQYEEKTESTFQIGSAVEVDYKILKRSPQLMDRALNDRLYDLGQSLDYRIINGDPQTNNNVDVRGLKERLDTVETNLFNSTDMNIATAANFKLFVSYLRKANRAVKKVAGNVTVGFTSEMVYDGIIAGRMELGGAAYIGSKYTDLLNTEDLIEVEGVPIVFCRQNDAGSDVISVVEGVSTNTSSLYLISLGFGVDDDGTLPNGLLGLSDGDVQITPQVDGNIRRLTIDYQYGLAAPLRCAARIRQLKAS